MNSWFQALLDLLLPPRCPECGREMDDYGEWCSACQKKYRLNIKLDVKSHDLIYVDEVTVLADYSGAVRRLLQKIKYGRRRAAVAYLQAFLPQDAFSGVPSACGVVGTDTSASCVSNAACRDVASGFVVASGAAPTVVVPVPVHPRRLKKRGYNQTTLIFRGWAEKNRLAWREALSRVKETAPQYQLDPAARRENIKGAFSVTRPEGILNQRVLLVDDIFTSGSTLDECAHELRRAGADSVQALVVASSAR